eukprot:UN32135
MTVHFVTIASRSWITVITMTFMSIIVMTSVQITTSIVFNTVFWITISKQTTKTISFTIPNCMTLVVIFTHHLTFVQGFHFVFFPHWWKPVAT